MENIIALLNSISIENIKSSPKKNCKTVNLLGYSFRKTENSKLVTYLCLKGYKFESLENIEKFITSKVNIVVEPQWLEIAKLMKRRFKIPFVNLTEISNIELLLDEYLKLQKILNIDISKEIDNTIKEIFILKNKIKKRNKFYKFFATSDTVETLETIKILEDVKVIPKLLLLNKNTSCQKKQIRSYIHKYDLHCIRTQKIDSVIEFYQTFSSLNFDFDFYIGKQTFPSLDKNEIHYIETNYLKNQKYGFEGIQFILNNFLNTLN